MKSYLTLSGFAGVLFGVLSYFICKAVLPAHALLVGIVVGILSAAVLLPTLILQEKAMNKKYAAFEATITSPIFLKANGNFTMVGRVRNGNIYFCEKGIIFASLDQSPTAIEQLLRHEIQRYEFDQAHMNVFATDGRKFLITTPDAQKIFATLKERNWVE